MSNVPKVTRLYDDDSTYPTISSPLSTNFYTEEIPVSGITLGEKEGVFYMAENIRWHYLKILCEESELIETSIGFAAV